MHQENLDQLHPERSTKAVGPVKLAASSTDFSGLVERWRPVLSGFLVPLIAVCLFGLAIWTIHHSIAAIRFSQIRQEIVAIPGHILLLACGLTAFSFLALAFQDFVALWSTGKKISFWRAALGSYIAQSVAHSTGFSILIGGALRCRYYMSEGLSFADTMKVQLSFSGTFGMATCILLGASFLLDPSLAAAQTAFLPVWLVRMIGGLLLLGPAAIFAWRIVHVGPLKFLRWQIDMPATRHLLPQTLLSLTDVSCMGAVLFVFLPDSLHISYPALIGLFAVAMTIGVTSHVPGGLGVFEATILLLVSPAPEFLPALLSALVMFRFIYYFLPLVLGGVAVAITEGLRHRQKLRLLTETPDGARSPMVPIVFAMLTFLAGTIMLASSALPGTSWRVRLVSDVLPQSVLETAHLISAVIGTFLLLLGRGLSRRLAGAWSATQALLVAGVVVALLKGFEYEVAALFALLFTALLPCRSQFYRSGPLINQRLTPAWMLGIAAVVLFMCWLLAFVYRHLDYSQSALMQFELQRHASRSLRAIVAMLMALSGVVIWQSFRLVQRGAAARADVDYRHLAQLVRRSPRSSSHLALTGDKSFLWNNDADTCIIYGVRGHSLIGIGVPIGPKRGWSDLIWDLRDRADRGGKRVVFFDIDSETLPVYLDLGLQAVQLGSQPYLSLSAFDPAAWLAAAAPGARMPQPNTTLSVEIYQGDAVDRIMSDIAAISSDWLQAQHLRERHMVCGHFSRDYIALCPVAVLRQDGKIVAFAVLWCGADRDECEIDLLRWSPDASTFAPYQMLAGILDWAKAEGYRRLALGLQPPDQGLDARVAPFWHEITVSQATANQAEALAADKKNPPLTTMELLTATTQRELPISHEASYLLYPIGQLVQSERDLIDLINLGPAAS